MRWELRYGVVCFGILLALMGAGEVGARVWLHVRYRVTGHSYGRWRADPALGARMAASRYNHRFRTNDGGFRNDEDLVETPPSGSLRVICYGGSTTLCWNLPTPQTWPARLEAILREQRRQGGDQVLNAGDILWSIGHVALRAREEVPRLRPDVVIIASGLNEEGNARLLAASGRSLEREVQAGRYGACARNLPQSAWLARNSVVFALGQRFLTRPLARTVRHLRHDRWAALARARGAAVVDAQRIVDAWPGDPMQLFRELAIHWSALGAEELAEAIWEGGFAGEAVPPAVGRHE